MMRVAQPRVAVRHPASSSPIAAVESLPSFVAVDALRSVSGRVSGRRLRPVMQQAQQRASSDEPVPERSTIRAHIMTKLTFLGAARTVTGSKYLLEAGGRKILIDCGLFQGLKELRLRNWEPLPFDPSDLSAVVLTHAHLDHTGYLPRLVADGYHGRVFCTPGTADLCKLVLPDSARLQEEDAREANRLQLFEAPPGAAAVSRSRTRSARSRSFSPSAFNRPYSLVEGVDIEFINAGHLLGSAFIRMTIKGGPTVLFGGDLGRYSRPVLPGSVAAAAGRCAARSNRPTAIAFTSPTIGAHVSRRSSRTRLRREASSSSRRSRSAGSKRCCTGSRSSRTTGRFPKLPVFLDSPMALEALRYYANRASELDPDIQAAVEDSAVLHRALSAGVVGAAVVRARAVEDSVDRRLVERHGDRRPRAASPVGALPDKRSTVLFVGYQAAGTRGRQLVDGAREVKIHGQLVPVNARIERIDSMSAHADSVETLRWLGGFTTTAAHDVSRARRARPDGRAESDNGVAAALECAHACAPRASGVKLNWLMLRGFSP